ncbi:MAG: tetratricopeptide repeat protein [Acidiferrobacterales bacterium]
MSEDQASPTETSTTSTTPSTPQAALSDDVLYDILVGEIAEKRGQFDVAISSLTRAAEKTRDPRLAERATFAALKAKRYDDALGSAKLWVELQPRSQRAHEAVAAIYLQLGRLADAQRHFQEMLTIAASVQKQDRAYRRIALVLGHQQDRAAALESMQMLVKADADNPNAHYALAHLAVRTDNLDVAISAVTRALELRPAWDEAALFKAGILVSQKDAVKAQAFYESYLVEYPKATLVRLNYARYLVDLTQWEKAREQFLLVLEQSPNDADSLYAIGLLSLQINNIDDAENYLKQTLKLRPDHQQARIYLGQIAEERKDYAQAGRWYREVILGEYYFEAQTRLGVVMARQGDLDGAREHLRRIQPQTDNQRVQLYLAEEQILREAKQYDEALSLLDSALEQVPKNQDLLYARALIAEKLDKIDLTEGDLRAILQQDPDNAQALNALGYTLADRTDRHQEALKLIQRALELKPDDPFILDSMGWVQYRLGNSAEAIKYLKRALSIRNDAEISAHLGEVLWVTGDRTQARSVWKKALEDTPDSEVLNGVIKKFNP